jgi:acylphosphatase
MRRVGIFGCVIRRRVIVSGQVQGVFFRDTCLREASANRVSGWVRNRRDGTVEAVFQGAEADVGMMVSWAHRGPRGARVERVDIFIEDPQPLNGFEVRPTG